MLGFKRRFCPYVWEGSKTHTIRLKRVLRPTPGETVRAYADSRQKTMALLGSWECTKVEQIEIDRYANIRVDGLQLDTTERELLCWRDGFRPKGSRLAPEALEFQRLVPSASNVLYHDGTTSFDVFWEYWQSEAKDPKRSFPFIGDLIHWRFDLSTRAPLPPQLTYYCERCGWFGRTAKEEYCSECASKIRKARAGCVPGLEVRLTSECIEAALP